MVNWSNHRGELVEPYLDMDSSLIKPYNTGLLYARLKSSAQHFTFFQRPTARALTLPEGSSGISTNRAIH
jgi:hypothetical protein